MILAQLRGDKRTPASVPAGTRVYAVGDIHGRVDLLVRLEEQIRRDAAGCDTPRKVLVHIGDYVDRGLDSRAVIDHLLENPMAGLETVCLKGNHDAWLLGFLEDPGLGEEWLAHGGQATLLSYGIGLSAGGTMPERLRDTAMRLGQALPPAHRAFLEALELSHVEGDYLFVHAGIRPGVGLEHQSERDLLWIRGEFTRDRRSHEMIVVHGHTVTDAPEVRANRIGIDTGAYATGRLTCLVLEAAERRFLTT